MTEGGWEYQAFMSDTPARFGGRVEMPAYSSQYVTNVHTSCGRNGCQYQEAVKCLAAAQQVLDAAKEKKMASEWCEYGSDTDADGGHPFNGKTGKVEFQRIIYYPSGDVDAAEPVTMCMKHGKETGLMPGPKDDVHDGEVVGEITG